MVYKDVLSPECANLEFWTKWTAKLNAARFYERREEAKRKAEAQVKLFS